tara:strand:- start:879 stop:1670 length:792 start_codon:yes stop_codon:yes gene_type:complete
MAIANIHYTLIRKLREQNSLPYCNTILEIGEHNWYGDLNPELLFNDIKLFAKESEKKDLEVQLNSLFKQKYEKRVFGIAKIFYKIFFHSQSIESIDLDGTSSARKLDLNLPHDLGKKFDCIINLGTSEHVFNVYQVFRSIHEWIRKDGIIIHHLPMYGEIDHGFYNFHPTFLYDLSLANQYQPITVAKATMKDIVVFRDRNDFTKDILSMDKEKSYALLAVLKNLSSEDFKIPMQGVYDDNLATKKSIEDAWLRQRHIANESS